MSEKELDTVALDALFKFAPVGLALIDRQKRYIRINDTLARMNGVPAADHIGRTPTEVILQVAAAVESVLDHVLQTKLPLVGLEMEPPLIDGVPQGSVAEVNIYPLLENGTAVGVLGIISMRPASAT